MAKYFFWMAAADGQGIGSGDYSSRSVSASAPVEESVSEAGSRSITCQGGKSGLKLTSFLIDNGQASVRAGIVPFPAPALWWRWRTRIRSVSVAAAAEAMVLIVVFMAYSSFCVIAFFVHDMAWTVPMNVLAINGSPRKRWDTALLLEKALEGTASRDADTECKSL